MFALWGDEGSERRTGPDVVFYNVVAYGQEKKPSLDDQQTVCWAEGTRGGPQQRPGYLPGVRVEVGGGDTGTQAKGGAWREDNLSSTVATRQDRAG